MIVLLLTNKTLGHEARKLVAAFEARGHQVDVNTPTATPHVVLARHLGNKNPENLGLALHYQNMGIPVINTPQSAALAKNKYEAGKLFEANGLPTPRTQELTTLDHDFEYPLVAKVLRGSQGKGVYLCKDRQELEEVSQKHGTMIIQEFVSTRPGEDLRVFVVGGRVVGVMKRKSINGDFRANISQGGVGEPYQLTPEIETLALTVAKIVGLDICGVDLLFADAGFKVCEVNATPGFRGFDKYCGSSMADLIVDYVVERTNENNINSN
jgi:gamma-F420-2:alpha-L-glutamate ligase